jgi:hypothetical protein
VALVGPRTKLLQSSPAVLGRILATSGDFTVLCGFTVPTRSNDLVALIACQVHGRCCRISSLVDNNKVDAVLRNHLC